MPQACRRRRFARTIGPAEARPRRHSRNRTSMKTLRMTAMPAAALALSLCAATAIGAAPKDITNSIGMKLVQVQPGSFLMGQDGPAADYNVKKHAEKFDDA